MACEVGSFHKFSTSVVDVKDQTELGCNSCLSCLTFVIVDVIKKRLICDFLGTIFKCDKRTQNILFKSQ